jgi:hypothetical protein
MDLASRPHSPHWYGIPLRVLLLTFLGTLLCFSASLLLAIMATIAVARWHGLSPDMRIAYRHFAFPMAAVEAGIIFLLATAIEIRHYRQRKTLAALERMG